MKVRKPLRTAARGAAAAMALTMGALAVTSVPAAAAMGAGRVQLCSQGNYASQLKFVGSQFSTYIAMPQSCVKADIPVGTTRINVMGLWNKSGSSFHIGNFPATASDNPGWKVSTKGSTANGGATVSYSTSRN